MKNVVSRCVNKFITCSPHIHWHPWGSHLHMMFSPCTCLSVTFPFILYDFLSEVVPGPPPLGRGDLSSAGNVPIASSVVLFQSANCFVFMTLFFTRLCLRWQFLLSLKNSRPLHSSRSSCFLMSSLLFWPRSHPTASRDNGFLMNSPAPPSYYKTLHSTAVPVQSVLPSSPGRLVSLHTIFPFYVSVPKFPLLIRTPVIPD